MGRRVVIESRSLSNPRLKRTVIEISDEDEQFYQGVRQILAELPETDDITILTLKGHLIVEQLLIRIIESAAINPAPLKNLNRLQFSTRVVLAESLAPPSVRREKEIWPLVRMVGKIRNDIAHQLRPKKLDEEIQAFLDSYIRYFGVRVTPSGDLPKRDRVTKDNYLIPQEVRKGTTAQKYRNALAGTSQGLCGVLGVIRDNAKLARAALDRKHDKSKKIRTTKGRNDGF